MVEYNQINRYMVNAIWFRFDLIRFRKDFSVCGLGRRWPFSFFFEGKKTARSLIKKDYSGSRDCFTGLMASNVFRSNQIHFEGCEYFLDLCNQFRTFLILNRRPFKWHRINTAWLLYTLEKLNIFPPLFFISIHW